MIEADWKHNTHGIKNNMQDHASRLKHRNTHEQGVVSGIQPRKVEKTHASKSALCCGIYPTVCHTLLANKKSNHGNEEVDDGGDGDDGVDDDDDDDETSDDEEKENDDEDYDNVGKYLITLPPTHIQNWG